MRTWIWHGLSFDLPEEWEMLQFSRKPEAGRCAWADRDGYRMEVFWKRLPSAPAMDLLLATFPQRLGEEQGSVVVPLPDVNRWKRWRVGEGARSRIHALCFESGRLLEVVFSRPSGETGDGSLVLNAFRAESEQSVSRWAAFGMKWEVPPGHSMVSSVVQPARAEVEMCDRRKREVLRFLRLGMVSHWLHDEPQDWLRRRLPNGYKLETEELVSLRDGRIAAVLSGGPRWPAILPWARPPGWAACVWLEPSDGRLYCVERLSRRPTDSRALPDRLAPQKILSQPMEVACV